MKFYFVLSVIWLLKVQKRITDRKIKFGLTDSARPGKPVLQGEFYFLPCFTLILYNLPSFTLTSINYHSLLCLLIICPFDLFSFHLRI
jgi:hypothetical protein